MSANEITPLYEVFTDIDGEPLEAGYIYVGQENLDPEVSPIQVYWDRALTVTASQPLRTIGGAVTNGGAPSRFYVNADGYSITVRNKNGSLIDTDLSHRRAIPFSSITGAATAATQLDSVNALRLGSYPEKTVYVISYYDGWQDTVEGPIGGELWHKTGADNTSPTVGAPVAVSTIGTGAQAGYIWDATGAEWAIDSPKNYIVDAFGKDGINDAVYVQDALDFGGGVELRKTSYLTSTTILPGNKNTLRSKSGLDVSTVGGDISESKIVYSGVGDAVAIGTLNVVGKSGVTIENIEIEKSGAAGSSVGLKITGDAASRSSGNKIECGVNGFGIGLHMQRSCFSNQFPRISIKNCTTGMFLEEECNDLTFGHVDINTCTTGISIGKTGGIGQDVIRFESLTIQNCSRPFEVIGNNTIGIECGALYIEGNSLGILLNSPVNIHVGLLSLEYSADVNMLDIQSTAKITADIILLKGNAGSAACINVGVANVRAFLLKVINQTSRPLIDFNGTTQDNFHYDDEASGINYRLMRRTLLDCPASATDRGLEVRVQGDTFAKIRIASDGSIRFIDEASGTLRGRLVKVSTGIQVDSGNLIISNGAWDQPHLVLGDLHIFKNGNDIRASIGAPASATDGALVVTAT